MTFITWTDNFETGIAQVDGQHRRLVEMIDAAAPYLSAAGGQPGERVQALLGELFAYAERHFHDEEALMRQHGLVAEYCDAHHRRHCGFVEQIAAIRSQLADAAAGEAGPTLLRFLTGWLTFHILDEDQRMARQIHAIEAGATPEQARLQADSVQPNDQARAALVAALLDLYGVVGERNRTLQTTNERLLQATRELAESNRGLEQRVAERTQELRDALALKERTQGQLLQSEKMAAIGQLAAGVAHEINNPVGFVTSNLGSLRKYVAGLLTVLDAYAGIEQTLPAGDPRRQRIDEALQAADLDFVKEDVTDLLDESTQGLERVRKIVQDLRDFSHVGETEWQEADINAGLESTLNVVWNELKYKVQVVREFGELPPVRCIVAQLNQVFMNLLVNAAQAIETQGTITLSTGSDGDRVWIEIADTGQGMSEEVKNRIFEPFFTTKPVGKGTGLGLSISWDIIVKKHGGSFAVDSVIGQGTTFRITLPVGGV